MAIASCILAIILFVLSLLLTTEDEWGWSIGCLVVGVLCLFAAGDFNTTPQKGPESIVSDQWSIVDNFEGPNKQKLVIMESVEHSEIQVLAKENTRGNHWEILGIVDVPDVPEQIEAEKEN